MDQFLDPIREAFEGQIDFSGQKLAELLSTALLIITGVSRSGVACFQYHGGRSPLTL